MDDNREQPRQGLRKIGANELQVIKANHPALTDGVGNDVLSEALSELPPDYGANQLRRAIEGIQDKFANEAMQAMDELSRNQLRHMMRMANLPPRDWMIFYPLVVIPDSPEFRDKMKKRVDACKCQGGKVKHGRGRRST